MSDVSPDESPEARNDAADAAGVRHRLAQEVAAWSAERSGRAHSGAADLVPTEGKPAVPPPKRAAKRPAAKPVQIKPPEAAGKPFSMSYDGVTSREYMDQVIARGTR